jgi:hypothetical protein
MPQVIVDGFEVSLNDLGQYIIAPVGGVAMPVAIDDYKAGLSAKLIAECPTLEAFRTRWVSPPNREEIIEMIVGVGYSPSVLRLVENMNDYDLYDVLADLAYGLSPRTRENRTLAFRYKHSSWLAGMPAAAGEAIKAIADQFSIGGTDDIRGDTEDLVAAPADRIRDHQTSQPYVRQPFGRPQPQPDGHNGSSAVSLPCKLRRRRWEAVRSRVHQLPGAGKLMSDAGLGEFGTRVHRSRGRRRDQSAHLLRLRLFRGRRRCLRECL